MIGDVVFSDRIPPDCDPDVQFGQSANACFAKTEEGYQFLLLVLERVDGGNSDEIVSQLSEMAEGAYITDRDGTRADKALHGNFIGPVVGFSVPISVQDFTLYWPDNPPIELGN